LALLNAVFGNATELIIALVALKAGLVDIVKASITGTSIYLVIFMGGATKGNSRLWRGWFLHDLGSDCNCFARW